MTIRSITAVLLLVVFIVVLVFIGTSIQRRRLTPKKVRSRDLAPRPLQQKRSLMAQYRRLHRGLRFPTLEQKRAHALFRKRVLWEVAKQARSSHG